MPVTWIRPAFQDNTTITVTDNGTSSNHPYGYDFLQVVSETTASFTTNVVYYATTGVTTHHTQSWDNQQINWSEAPILPREEIREEWRDACKRASGLLKSYLSPWQRTCLRKKGFFYVRSQMGRRYRIHAGMFERNVYRVKRINGRMVPTHRYCAHPDDARNMPWEDSIIAQMLMMISCERRFLKIANVIPI